MMRFPTGILLALFVMLVGCGPKMASDESSNKTTVKRELEPDVSWIPFSANVLNAELAKNQTVVVFVTAEWDVFSQILKRKVWQSTSIRERLAFLEAVMIEADYTEQSTEINDFMRSNEMLRVPSVAIYPPTMPNEPIVIKDPFSEDEVLSALSRAMKK